MAFDSALARALQGVRDVGLTHLQNKEEKKRLDVEMQDDALRRQLLQGQIVDDDQQRKERAAQLVALESFLKSRPDLDPQTIELIRNDPEMLGRYMQTKVFPTPRTTPQPGQDDLEGSVLEHLGKGSSIDQAVAKAIKANPTQAAGIRAAGERVRSRRASESRADERLDRSTGPTATDLTSARNSARGGARGLARRFQGPVSPEARSYVERVRESALQSLREKYGGVLSEDELMGILDDELRKAQAPRGRATTGRLLPPREPSEEDAEVEDIVEQVRRSRGG